MRKTVSLLGQKYDLNANLNSPIARIINGNSNER
jgi:hypothetical protein